MKYLISFMIFSTPLISNELNIKVKEFKYKNHDYLIFKGNIILHDPDCQCTQEWRGYINEPHPGEIVIFRNFEG